MKTLAIINTLPASREQVATFTYELKKELLSSKDILKEFAKIKYGEKIFAEILKDEDIENEILREFQLYEAEKIIEVLGTKISVSEVGTKYDYKASGDSVWNDLDKRIAFLTEKRKERETLLKTLPDEGLVDPETGLFITRAPKSSKTKVICRIY
jgi:hypothetical protein